MCIKRPWNPLSCHCELWAVSCQYFIVPLNLGSVTGAFCSCFSGFSHAYSSKLDCGSQKWGRKTMAKVDMDRLAQSVAEHVFGNNWNLLGQDPLQIHFLSHSNILSRGINILYSAWCLCSCVPPSPPHTHSLSAHELWVQLRGQRIYLQHQLRELQECYYCEPSH